MCVCVRAPVHMSVCAQYLICIYMACFLACQSYLTAFLPLITSLPTYIYMGGSLESCTRDFCVTHFVGIYSKNLKSQENRCLHALIDISTTA